MKRLPEMATAITALAGRAADRNRYLKTHRKRLLTRRSLPMADQFPPRFSAVTQFSNRIQQGPRQELHPEINRGD